MKIGAFEIQEPLPEAKDIHAIGMLRPWVDAGSVATIALTRLERHLGAQEIGKLARPGTFFDFTRYRPLTHEVDGKRVFTLPNSNIYFVHRPEGASFLLLHLLEPHAFAEDYIDSIVQLLNAFKVKRYCRLGGMYDVVPHTRPLLVSGAAGSKPLEGVGGVIFRQRRPYQGPTSIMGLITGELEKSNIENMNLMVHLPQYVELEEDYTGASRLLEILCSIYNLPAELSSSEEGQRQYREINSKVDQNPAAKAFVKRLEADYDAQVASGAYPSSFQDAAPPLSPQLQDFLEQLGKQLDNPS